MVQIPALLFLVCFESNQLNLKWIWRCGCRADKRKHLMKKLSLFVILFYTSLTIMAQDVIVKQDGSTILSKVMEINSAEIKYKKWSNVDGPIYAISRSEVLSINYQNGEVEVFSTMIEDDLDNLVNSFQGTMEYRNKGKESQLVVFPSIIINNQFGGAAAVTLSLNF